MARVLMIEDNPNDQKLVSMLLASTFEFSYASSLQEAYRLLESGIPDVVLLDLNLPDSRGMCTLTSIVKMYPNLPIVVWSGADEAADAIHAGADEFLLKNGNLADVEKALQSAITRHKFKDVRQDISALQRMMESDKKGVG